MRKLLALAPAALLACSAPTTAHQPLDGVWALSSAVRSPLDPRTLTLAQNGSNVSGSGNAMGVDAPLGVSVEGSTTDSDVELTFNYDNGGGVTADYTATVGTDGRLVGVLVLRGSLTVSHKLTYMRK